MKFTKINEERVRYMSFLGKILPIDGYQVVLNDSLTNNYTKSLVHLYQPLIGFESIALYQTLLHEIDLQDDHPLQTHHSLMNYLNVSLDRIYDMRLKLEGIGLLKTYEQNNEENRVYVYELFSPFSPSEFFQDVMLTELLYHHLGEAKFKVLKDHYDKIDKRIIGENVTASFQDVFQTFTPTHLPNENVDKVPEQINVTVNMIDFTHIQQTLQKQMIPLQNVLTERNKEVISQLSHLYDLDAYEVEKSILWALNDENRLNVEEFKSACHDLFRAKHNQVPIRLEKKEESVQNKVKKPMTKEEKLVDTLQNISPKQLLEDLSSGGHASEQDMKLIRDVMVKQGLSTPVMNVLIHFVLLQTNMQLSKAYLEKIAGHWSRANLKNAKEAMIFAKQQVNQFKQRQPKRRTATNEVIPDWFKNRDEKSNVKEKNYPKKQNQSSEEKEEVLALLQKHASKKD